jgi:hypothetical protein
MVHQLRHRCPKGAATVAMNLRSPRHILTLLPLVSCCEIVVDRLPQIGVKHFAA